jgi:YD repeat-containing protein
VTTYDGSNTYVYDAENRLVGVTGSRTANLVYDPFGRLSSVDQRTSATTSRFLTTATVSRSNMTMNV